MFEGVFAVAFCLSGWDPYLVSGELPQLWLIPMEIPSCATSECHQWAVNLRLLPFVVTWLTCGFNNGSMRREKGAFKAKASLSKIFSPPRCAAGTWPLGFMIFIFKFKMSHRPKINFLKLS